LTIYLYLVVKVLTVTAHLNFVFAERMMTMPSRKNSPNKNPRSNFKPENHFDRVIIKYDWKSEEGLGKLERYMHDCGAIFDPTRDRPYAAIKRLTKDRPRKEASTYEISHFNEDIPPVDQKDVEALLPKLLPVNDQLIFQWREEGWPYLYFRNNVCLYVGITKGYPVQRATVHLDQPKNAKWGKYIKSCQHDHQGWYIRWLDLSDCEKLVRKSLILPSEREDTDTHMKQIDEEYQERNRVYPDWWLGFAELVLIRAFHSLYNRQSLPQDRELVNL